MKKEIILTIFVSFMFVMLFKTPIVYSAPELNTSNMTVEAGNVTAFNLEGDSTSSVWQGLYGTVSGGVKLDNSGGQTMYDWNLVQAQGEIMATRFVIDDWSTIACSTQNEIYWEEYRLNIANSSQEGINDTFQNTTHPSFDIGITGLTGCRSTLTHNYTDDEVVFWNVLLNIDENITVFVGILEDGTIGFNNTASDFQLLVPTNTTTEQAIYNLYLDLG
jgi:hypothetical protein